MFFILIYDAGRLFDIFYRGGMNMENEKKKTMIVEEDNTIYEIDLECIMRKKREKEEEKRQAVEEGKEPDLSKHSW